MNCLYLNAYSKIACKRLLYRTDMGKAAQSMSADDDDAEGEALTDG